MKTAQTPKRNLTGNRSIKFTLAMFLLATAVGCQRVRVRKEQAPATESVPSDAEKLLSQVKQLEENQKSIMEDVASIKVDQLTIGTKVAGAQRQLANQLAEDAQTIQQERADLKTTVQDLAGRQQGLERVIETIHADGQSLRTSHEQGLQQLLELKQGYQDWQEELSLMQEKMAALDTSLVAMQVGLGQFKSVLTGEIKGLTENLASKRAVEQDIEEQLTTLTRILTDTAALPKRPLTLFPDIDKTVKPQKKTYHNAFRFAEPETDQVSKSSQINVETAPGVDSPQGP